MRTSARLALAVASLGAALLVATPATASEPPIGICSYNIDWGVFEDLPEPARGAFFAVVCRI